MQHESPVPHPGWALSHTTEEEVMTKKAAAYESLQARLREQPRRWLVTGVAGFIGSHLMEHLLKLDQTVAGLDNFATGSRRNLSDVLALVTKEQAARFTFHEGDIRDPEACARACAGADAVLHQAALGSVPRSIKDPFHTHDVNLSGFVRVLDAARAAGVKRIVYASSSSVYGDHPALPKVEETIGNPLSPYAVTKLGNELYANTFGRCYGLELMGLRYFNVFGPRQDPNGQYAAVIPRWYAAMLGQGQLVINGDGETSRDFCYIDNVVQANLLAATVEKPEAANQAYNVACGERTTLNQLFELIREQVARTRPEARSIRAVHGEFRPGDVRHSLADIGKIERLLGYQPTHTIGEGLDLATAWYTSPKALAAV